MNPPALDPRLQPHSDEAEQSVLGSVLLDNDSLKKAMEILTEEDFYRTAHSKIFRAMVDLSEHKTAITNLTLTAELEARGQLAEIGGRAYLAELLTDISSAAGVEAHARIIRDCAERRRMIYEAEALIAGLYEGRPLAGTSSGSGDCVLLRMADVKSCQIHWLWPGRIPLGKLTVIDGDPGLGKSLLTLDLAARLTRGDGMPDGSGSDLNGPRGVVLLSAEDDPADTIRPRLDAAGADVSRIVILASVRDGAEQRGPHIGDLDAIRHAITDVGAALVIIDPLMAHVPEDRNTHRDQDIRRALAPLAALAADTGVAVIVVRHLNKTAGVNPLYRGGGSIGIIGAARSGLLVAVDPEDAEGSTRVLAIQKANLAARAPSLKYRITEVRPGVAGVAWVGESNLSAYDLLDAAGQDQEGKSELDETSSWLIATLKDGPVQTKQLQRDAEGAGHSWATVRRAQRRLKVLVVKEDFKGGWTWRLPPEDAQ